MLGCVIFSLKLKTLVPTSVKHVTWKHRPERSSQKEDEMYN